MKSDWVNESGSIMFGILLVISVLFLFFWGLKYALSQEWHLLRKKVAWVEQIDIAKLQEMSKGKEEVIIDTIEGSHVTCNLYQQKMDIRTSKQWGYHQLQVVNPCYSDFYAQLSVDYHLSAITDYQDIAHIRYRYEKGVIQPKLFEASLIHFAKIDSETVEVIIYYDNKQYRYLLPLLDGEDSLQYKLVTGVMNGGRGGALIINQTLWLLPFTDEQKPTAQTLPFKHDSIWIASLVEPITITQKSGESDNLFFLIEGNQSQLRLYSKGYYQNHWEEIGRWQVDSSEEQSNPFTSQWRLGGWELLHIDRLGVLLRLESEIFTEESQKLFAVTWEGAPIWGNRVIWERRSYQEIDCGLQQTLFEPIEGWVLGCQRLRVGKVMVE